VVLAGSWVATSSRSSAATLEEPSTPISAPSPEEFSQPPRSDSLPQGQSPWLGGQKVIGGSGGSVLSGQPSSFATMSMSLVASTPAEPNTASW